MTGSQAVPMLRRTNRGHDMPLNYFENTVGSQEDEAIRPHLLVIKNFASNFGFKNLFDVVLMEARLSPVDAHAFAEEGGLHCDVMAVSHVLVSSHVVIVG